MRVLLSTIGSRGDVQPMVALAVQLRELGQEVRVCAPPDFRDWIEDLGIPFVPLGPEVRSTAKPSPAQARPSAEQMRQMIEGTVATQFETIPTAAQGCDVIVAGNALQIAARSVAEQMGNPLRLRRLLPDYSAIPTPRATQSAGVDTERPQRPTIAHYGPRMPNAGTSAGAPLSTPIGRQPAWHRSLTCEATSSPTSPGWPPTRRWRPGLSLRIRMCFRRAPGFCPISVHCLPSWRRSSRPASHRSTSASAALALREDLSKAMIETARALGRRAIVSRGWADLSLVDNAPDCLSIGEVNQQALFKRVAAVVHHGGAGTTTAATGAGAPQVVIPQQLRPVLLRTTNQRPRNRKRTPARRTDHRLADERTQARPPTRVWLPVPNPSPLQCAATAHWPPPSA